MYAIKAAAKINAGADEKQLSIIPLGTGDKAKRPIPTSSHLLVWYLLLLDACGLDVLFTRSSLARFLRRALKAHVQPQSGCEWNSYEGALPCIGVVIVVTLQDHRQYTLQTQGILSMIGKAFSRDRSLSSVNGSVMLVNTCLYFTLNSNNSPIYGSPLIEFL